MLHFYTFLLHNLFEINLSDSHCNSSNHLGSVGKVPMNFWWNPIESPSHLVGPRVSPATSPGGDFFVRQRWRSLDIYCTWWNSLLVVWLLVGCLDVAWLYGSLLVGWLVVWLLVVGCCLLLLCCFFFGIFVCFLRTKVCGADGAVVANIAVRLTLPNLSPTNRSSEEDREIWRKTVRSGFETRNSEIWNDFNRKQMDNVWIMFVSITFNYGVLYVFLPCFAICFFFNAGSFYIPMINLMIFFAPSPLWKLNHEQNRIWLPKIT